MCAKFGPDRLKKGIFNSEHTAEPDQFVNFEGHERKISGKNATASCFCSFPDDHEGIDDRYLPICMDCAHLEKLMSNLPLIFAVRSYIMNHRSPGQHCWFY
ncbi:unnamed protein product [Cylicocyclus nassatus]|uniref:Uncharacterized protein n=1 Tax=Cylicocyclus nassatus TaxID=53992 RepID=A0AA36GVW7_CYLNA|nr:unnamed protein product [Cylicocyclus nassatus]